MESCLYFWGRNEGRVLAELQCKFTLFALMTRFPEMCLTFGRGNRPSTKGGCGVTHHIPIYECMKSAGQYLRSEMSLTQMAKGATLTGGNVGNSPTLVTGGGRAIMVAGVREGKKYVGRGPRVGLGFGCKDKMFRLMDG